MRPREKCRDHFREREMQRQRPRAERAGVRVSCGSRSGHERGFGRHVARIAKQAELRLKFSRPKVRSVTILFDSRGGLMPPAFERELKAALSQFEKRYGVGKS